MKMRAAVLLTLVALAPVCLAPAEGAKQTREDILQQGLLSADAAEKLNRFDDAFSLLAARYKVALVCESAPRVHELIPKQATALRAALAAPENRSEEAQIKVVAKAHDYDAVRANSQTFLLKKHYTDPEDLPEVTLEEAAFSFKNLMKAAAPVYGDGGNEEAAVRNLVNAATPERRRQLAKGIPISSLPPALKSLPWRLASMGSIQFPMDNVNGIYYRLQGALRPTTYFGQVVYAKNTYSSYTGILNPRGYKKTVTLSYRMMTQPGGGTGFDLFPGLDVGEDGRIIGEYTEPTDPNKTPPVAVPPSLFQTRLDQFATSLNARIAKSPPDTLAKNALRKVEVDDALARKTVCVFGGGWAAPTQLTQAVNGVYDLRLTQTAAGVVRITLPVTHPIGSGKEFAREFRRLLPGPFLRAMSAAWSLESASPTPPLGEPHIGKRLFIASVKRLRTIIDPKIEAAENKTVLFPDAPDEARDLVGLSCMALCDSSLKRLMEPKPDFLDQIGQANFSIVVEDGRAICSIIVDRGAGPENAMQISIGMDPNPNPPLKGTRAPVQQSGGGKP